MRLILPYAGLAPEALRVIWLMSGRVGRWESPTSRQGAKTGFVVNEFRAFDLGRQKWQQVLLNDLCPVMHLYHRLYASPALRTAVARVIRSWIPCPRWEALAFDRQWDSMAPGPDRDVIGFKLQEWVERNGALRPG